MSKISHVRLVRLNDCARMIRTVGHAVTIIVRGEPGIGKSAILKQIAIMNGDKWRKVGDYFPEDKYQYIYVDCADLQYGDLKAVIPVHDTKSLEEYVNGILGMDDPRPKVIMFDEVLKLPKAMKPIVTRTMRERTAGNKPFVPGTLVFGTSNNAEDNVGDTTQAHEGSRVSFVRMAKPGLPEWLPWAVENRMDPMLIGWARMEPSIFDSYMTLTREALNANPHIYNPWKPQTTFVTLRTLEMANEFVVNEQVLGRDVALAGIAGCLGEAAANSLETFFELNKEIVEFDTIKANPATAPIPGNDIVALLTLLRTVRFIKTQEDLTAVIEYMKRYKSVELQSCFCVSVLKDPQTDRMASRNEYLKQWRIANIEYMI